MFDPTAQPLAAPDLTDRQQAVLDVLCSHAAEHGYPPTVREIGALLGLTSSSTVHSHLAALERAGIIERDPTKPRALKWGPAAASAGVGVEGGTDIGPARTQGLHGDVDVEPSVALPALGRVAAGAPILAEEHVEQYLPVPKQLTRQGESFLLKVRGDSMVGAGILDGDWVVVRRQPTARDGEIVVALVGDDAEATCKRFGHERGRVVLYPENPDLQPIHPDACELVGVVTGVMRAI